MHVLTREYSDIDKPADLAGKKVSWASKSADAWLKFVTILNLDHDVEPDALEFVQTAPPASTSLLAEGELDAILQYEPLVTKALLDNDFEVVYSPRQAWNDLEGLPLTTVDLAWTQAWYQNNNDTASRLRDAFEQGQQYLNDNLGPVLDDNADLFGLETEEQISLAKDRLAGIYPTTWSDDVFDSEYRIVEHANEIGLIEAEPTRDIFRAEA
jgi:ABC-type nitrate/sulfonate/bicarbonate transport system substrate-binding protein